MEGKWTPGEWRLAELHALGLYDNDGSAKILAGRGDDSVAVASVAAHASMKRGQGSNLADPERDANAHLIAAAPAMADAIAGYLSAKAALAEFESENPNDSTSNWERLFDARCAAEDQLQAALSQALGEPS